MAGIQVTGKPLAGEQQQFVNEFLQAVAAAGGTQVDVLSGYRSPMHNAAVGGVQGSDHTRGVALDSRVFIPGKGWVAGGDLSTLGQYGLRSGDQPGFFNGAPDPNHVDAGYKAGAVQQLPNATPGEYKTAVGDLPNARAGAPTQVAPLAAAAAGSSAWPASAQLAYQDALKTGLNPTQAEDFAAVQYGESGFNPAAVNKTSGAAGAYQLLSPGYINKANQMGGVLNPQANIEAILPDYAAYYRSHQQFVPGAAGAAVERSGEPAAYYAQGWRQLAGAAPSSAPTLAAAAAPAFNRPAFAQGLVGAQNSKGVISQQGLLAAILAGRGA